MKFEEGKSYKAKCTLNPYWAKRMWLLTQDCEEKVARLVREAIIDKLQKELPDPNKPKRV